MGFCVLDTDFKVGKRGAAEITSSGNETYVTKFVTPGANNLIKPSLRAGYRLDDLSKTSYENTD